MNHCLNYGDHEMPIMQLYAPANPYAIENDHEYCKTRSIDRLLDKLGLKNITLQRIIDIERRTRGQSNNKDWFIERECRISSTFFKGCMLHDKRTQCETASRIYFIQTYVHFEGNKTWTNLRKRS